jgi:hypothetical protein
MKEDIEGGDEEGAKRGGGGGWRREPLNGPTRAKSSSNRGLWAANKSDDSGCDLLV